MAGLGKLLDECADTYNVVKSARISFYVEEGRNYMARIVGVFLPSKDGNMEPIASICEVKARTSKKESA